MIVNIGEVTSTVINAAFRYGLGIAAGVCAGLAVIDVIFS